MKHVVINKTDLSNCFEDTNGDLGPVALLLQHRLNVEGSRFVARMLDDYGDDTVSDMFEDMFGVGSLSFDDLWNHLTRQGCPEGLTFIESPFKEAFIDTLQTMNEEGLLTSGQIDLTNHFFIVDKNEILAEVSLKF